MTIIALLLAALPNRANDDERTAMWMALGLAAISRVVVMVSGFVQFAFVEYGLYFNCV
ncbi:MAG: hypothetical protein ACI9DC_005608 [Gammaproteobacteria bacterium]